MDEDAARTSRHQDIALELLEDVAAGRYPVGKGFPVEAELQERFGVGRHTIRLALAALVEKGVIGRRRRAGTVVLSQLPMQRFEHSLRDVVGLSEFAQATTFEISREGFLINDGRSDLFDFENAARRWARYAGVRFSRSDHIPLCWSEVLVPCEMAPSRDEIIASQVPMYQLLMSQQAFELAAVEQNIQATQLTAGVADLLSAQPESAGLVVRRRYINENGSTFQIAANIYPAERYSVRTVLAPANGSGLPRSSATIIKTDNSLSPQSSGGSVMRFV